jgi:hypothetical protein
VKREAMQKVIAKIVELEHTTTNLLPPAVQLVASENTTVKRQVLPPVNASIAEQEHTTMKLPWPSVKIAVPENTTTKLKAKFRPLV